MHGMARQAVLFGLDPLARDWNWALDGKRGLLVPQRGTLLSDITRAPGYAFTRNGVASYELNAQGAPVLFGINQPRYVPGVGIWSRGALTNLLEYSCDLSNAVWLATGSVGKALLAEASPIAGQFVSRMTEAVGSTTNHRVQATPGGNIAAVANTLQLLVRKYGRSYLNIRTNMAQTGAALSNIVYNFDTQTFPVAGSGLVGTYLGTVGGFDRIAITGTSPDAKAPIVYLGPNTTAGDASVAPSYLGQANSGFDLAHAQLVAGTQPGPIIVTTGSTAAVGADDLRFTPPFATDQDFVAFAVVNFQEAGVDARPFTISDGTTSNRVLLYRQTSGTARLVAGGYDNVAGALTTGRAVLALRRRGSNWTVASKAGSTVTLGTEAAGTFPSGLNRLDIGSNLGANQPNSPLEFVGIRRGTFSDADLTAMLQAA